MACSFGGGDTANPHLEGSEVRPSETAECICVCVREWEAEREKCPGNRIHLNMTGFSQSVPESRMQCGVKGGFQGTLPGALRETSGSAPPL